jgi:cation transport ATPase
LNNSSVPDHRASPDQSPNEYASRPAPGSDPSPHFADLLDRPLDQRRREYQYRFAQSLVFGLPVFALQFFGRSLGGVESNRWVAIFQALLAGWVVYVGAAGMLFESLVHLARRRYTADLLPSAAAVALYLLTLPRVTTGRPGWFHWAVLVIALWTGVRWYHFRCRPALL